MEYIRGTLGVLVVPGCYFWFLGYIMGTWVGLVVPRWYLRYLSVIFLSKAGAYPNEALERSKTLD